MANSGEFKPGMPPSSRKNPSSQDFKDEVYGLERAVAATKKRIAEYKEKKANVTELEFHLKNLESRLENAKKKT